MYYLSESKKYNYYENYEDNDPVKLILDIDHKIKKNYDTDIDSFDDLLINCIEAVNDEIEKIY